MQQEVIKFYSSLRQIFGVCPSCDKVFRLSDCKLYQKKKPVTDWKEKIDTEIARLEQLQEKIEEKIELAREAAREIGRRQADKHIKKLDTIFYPLKLNPNDAKVVFHPVDFIVFNGMNNNNYGGGLIKNLVLLDKNDKTGEYLNIQKSVEKAVAGGKYEWLTLRVQENGTITEE